MSGEIARNIPAASDKAADKVGKLCRAVPDFESIRPYRDAEVPAVVRRLLRSSELRDGVASFLFPRLYRLSAGLARTLCAGLLRFRATRLRSVHDVQMMVRRFIDHMVRVSAESLTWSGLDQLDPGQPYLFISNHRDIALDSAFLNRVLHAEGFPTCRIAVGDNLFGTPHADDLMRLNRGFIVERSAVGARATFAALSRTSSYIRHSLAEGASVWIAQREGRAKDGLDKTEPALLKMLALAHRKDFARLDELLEAVQIVPVSISYELDPCDLLKAEELAQRAASGSYEKAADADLASIVQGVRGYKGRVHVHFSQPLQGSFESAEEIALAMDRAIVGGLKVYPPNTAAAADLAASGTADFDSFVGADDHPLRTIEPVNAAALAFFEERVASAAAHQRPYLLLQYANLLRNRNDLGLEVKPANGTATPAAT